MLGHEELFARERFGGLTVAGGVVIASRVAGTRGQNRRFEGLYGRIYDTVVQTPALRRSAFSLWGSADPLHDLEGFVADAVAAAPGASATIVDLPSGGGTLLPLLAREGFRGTVVEVDLAASMLARAITLHRTKTPSLGAVFVQADALELPLGDGIADVVVSLNGLHVVPDHARFLGESARITRPGGKLWLITPVNGPSRRSKAILAAARALRITPRTPPTLGELRALLARAGFAELHWYGGESITGIACEKRPNGG